jgi:hypothetical protein
LPSQVPRPPAHGVPAAALATLQVLPAPQVRGRQVVDAPQLAADTHATHW